MVTRKTWTEFRQTGLLWFINTILHMFGWALVVNVEEDGTITDAYPTRVEFRGFAEENNTQGYIKVSQYLKDNVDQLLREAQE